MRNRRRPRIVLSLALIIVALAVVTSYLLFSSKINDDKPVILPSSINVDVTSDHLIVVDVERDKVLYKKAASKRTRPASLAKIMTALVLIENIKDLDQRVKIPHDIYTYLNGSGIAVAGFRDGEELTVRDLLHGILFRSGAECCLTLANKVAGSEYEFVKLMNEKAAEIGMKDTIFGNPIGLDNPSCFTTVKDMAKLTQYALKNPEFKKIFCGYQYMVEPTNKNSEPEVMRNSALRRVGENKHGMFGGKLGNTMQAQLCMASVAKIQGREYICISTHATKTIVNDQPHIEDARIVYKAIEQAVAE